MTRMIAGFKAFKEGYMSAGADQAGEFADPDGRRLRYAINWAYFENTAYRDLHAWAQKYRSDYGLYKHIRPIYNPAFRLGEFWATHLLGGALDPEAGDGTTRHSAIPVQLGQGVKTQQGKAVRAAIARVWRDSNWQINKGIWTRYGTILGDAPLFIVDDVKRQKVYMKATHPGIVVDQDLDPFGNVKGYTIEESRPNPNGGPAVKYKEVCSRDGDAVVYQTYLNDQPYAWNGAAHTWDEPYGFVPMVAVQHLHIGQDWGWSELHAGLAKIREVDDLASNLHDQIRKSVNAPWLFSGIEDPRKAVTTKKTPPTPQRPAPGREEIPALYASDPSAKAQALIADLPIGETMGVIGELLKEIERDYPELQVDIWGAGGDVSGRALRIARQRAETKGQARRAVYDSALVRAHAMCLAIGGMRGYPGYEKFSIGSYAAGALEHAIAERPIFTPDPMDDIEIRGAFWGAAVQATTAGAPLVSYLQDAGWDEAKIEELVELQAQQAQAAVERARAAGLPSSADQANNNTQGTQGAADQADQGGTPSNPDRQ